MKLRLNLSERLFSLRYLDAFKGRVSLLGHVLEAVPQLVITEVEWEKAERKITDTASGDKTWAWNDEKGGTKDLALHDEVAAWLKEEIERQEKGGGFSLQDKAVIGLLQKLQ